MMLSAPTENEPAASVERFDVQTTRSDELRANLKVSGLLDSGAAAVLGQVIDGHIRAGRRFLRVNVGGVRSLGDSAIDVIARAHERLLARRGTMILTGVSAGMEAVLRAATPASPLLLVSPTAADRAR
jgi:anti-anti-sigma regulatory factor